MTRRPKRKVTRPGLDAQESRRDPELDAAPRRNRKMDERFRTGWRMLKGEGDLRRRLV